MRARAFLLLAGLLLLARPAAAQGACEDISRFFAEPPKLGEWADLQYDTKKQGDDPLLMRVAFVNTEQRQGRTMYRMQMVMTHGDGKRQVMQMLTPWGPEALAGDHDTEIVMKMGDQPAMVMPVKAGKKQPGLSDMRKECAKFKFVGEETVEVPAGSFRTRHYSGPDGDTWIASEVPGWRMVKTVTKDGDTVVLTGTGSGAKNEITEKPMDMKAMMGNPEMMKRMMGGNKGEDAK